MERQMLHAAAAAVLALSAAGAAVAATQPGSADGKRLYRKFCGQCHALSVANAAGFGSAKKQGLGQDGGPSFNQLRVPYSFSVTAVTEPTGGHELVEKKMSYKQLHVVASYVAEVTRHHPYPALPTDG